MIKNRIISSLRTIITTLLYVIANIAAVFTVDYISADFTIGPEYNAVLIVIVVAIANSLFWPIFRRFMMKGLVKHSGIGFVLVNSIANGRMIIAENGIYYLESDEVVGENPLEGFGKNAAMHLKRQNSFNNMPDVLVNSFYDSESDEVCAFEELIGSHGGLGGNQTKPFILYPSEWGDPGELVGSESIYHFLKEEIRNLNS